MIVVDVDRASGDTYCTASHLLRPALPSTSPQVLDWHFRYEDVFERSPSGEWRFRRRRIVIDWTETRPVSLPE